MKKEPPMKFKVAADPLPSIHSGGNKKYDWPFATMKVGECFYFPIKGDGVIAVSTARDKVTTSAREYRITGRKFVTRHIEEKKAIGCWRVA